MFCKHCGAVLENDMAFCSQCGEAVASPAQAEPTTYSQPVQPPYQAPVQPPFAQPMTSSALAHDVVKKQFCSPLMIVVAAAVTVFSLIALIDLFKVIGDTFGSIGNVFRYSNGEAVFLVLTVVTTYLLAMVALVCAVIGAWMMVYPTASRLSSGARVASIGTALLSAATFVYLVFNLYIAGRAIFEQLRYGMRINTNNLVPAILLLIFILALFIAAGIYFAKLGGFFRSAARHMSVGATRFDHVRGKGLGVLSIIFATFMLLSIILANTMSPYDPMYSLFKSYGDPVHTALAGMASFVSLGVFTIKFSMDAQRAR